MGAAFCAVVAGGGWLIFGRFFTWFKMSSRSDNSLSSVVIYGSSSMYLDGSGKSSIKVCKSSKIIERK